MASQRNVQPARQNLQRGDLLADEIVGFVDFGAFQTRQHGLVDDGFEQFDKIAFWKTPQAEGGKFVPYSRWTQDYIAIMGGR